MWAATGGQAGGLVPNTLLKHPVHPETDWQGHLLPDTISLRPDPQASRVLLPAEVLPVSREGCGDNVVQSTSNQGTPDYGQEAGQAQENQS